MHSVCGPGGTGWGDVQQNKTLLRNIFLNFEINQLPCKPPPRLILPSPPIDQAAVGFSPVFNLAAAFQILVPGLIL
jgi:hypothetical protein